MTDQSAAPSAIHTWREMVVLLNDAADRANEAVETDADLPSIGLWARCLAAAALQLLPSEDDDLLDEVAADAGPGAGAAELVRAAKSASRRYPIGEFPSGAAAVVADLHRLVAVVS